MVGSWAALGPTWWSKHLPGSPRGWPVHRWLYYHISSCFLSLFFPVSVTSCPPWTTTQVPTHRKGVPRSRMQGTLRVPWTYMVENAFLVNIFIEKWSHSLFLPISLVSIDTVSHFLRFFWTALCSHPCRGLGGAGGGPMALRTLWAGNCTLIGTPRLLSQEHRRSSWNELQRQNLGLSVSPRFPHTASPGSCPLTRSSQGHMGCLLGSWLPDISHQAPVCTSFSAQTPRGQTPPNPISTLSWQPRDLCLEPALQCPSWSSLGGIWSESHLATHCMKSVLQTLVHPRSWWCV